MKRLQSIFNLSRDRASYSRPRSDELLAAHSQTVLRCDGLRLFLCRNDNSECLKHDRLRPGAATLESDSAVGFVLPPASRSVFDFVSPAVRLSASRLSKIRVARPPPGVPSYATENEFVLRFAWP